MRLTVLGRFLGCVCAATAMAIAGSASAALILTGVVDGPRSGGLPKGIELYSTTAISDLADYGIRTTNSAEGTAGGPEFTFPSGSLPANTYIWVASDTTGFNTYFGFNPTYVNGVANINGDDAVVLYSSVLTTPAVADVYGVPTMDGTGSAWDYEDSYAYRVDNTGPDGGAWVPANWTTAGANFLDSQGTTGVNGGDGKTVPFGTYFAVPEPATCALVGLASVALIGFVRRR